jgi:hypothetical protein
MEVHEHRNCIDGKAEGAEIAIHVRADLRTEYESYIISASTFG